MDEMSEGNIFWPNMCRVAVTENIDSHYLLDAYDNGMVYGRRAFNGVQHQPNAIGIPLLPLSNHFIQGKMSHFLFLIILLFLCWRSHIG